MRFHKVRSVALPDVGNSKHCPPHSLLEDEGGNLYYSDEFNHSVLCLDKNGSIRWLIGGRGSAVGQFRYPRGMSLGPTYIEGQNCHCLAVCDAWNHRIQVFDLEGSFRCEWGRAGTLPFQEATDVRFIHAMPGLKGTEGYWLVLDRGNHRVCALGLDGKLLFQIGKGFPPSLEPKWAKQGINPVQEDMPEGFIRKFPAYDPLYYPTAIFGQSERALFVWQPTPRMLKQLFAGNLFPLSASPPDSGEWIAADETGLLGWSARTRRLGFYDGSGTLQYEAEVQGIPLRSNLPSNEVWLLTRNQIEKWRLCADRLRVEKQQPHTALLLKTLEDELARAVQDAFLQSAIGSFMEPFGHLEIISDKLIDLLNGEPPGTGLMRSLQEEMAAARAKLTCAVSDFAVSMHPLFLALLKLPLVANDHQQLLARAARVLAALAVPIHARFQELQRRKDEISIRRYALPQVSSGESDACGPVRFALIRQEDELSAAMKALQPWSGAVPASPGLLQWPPVTDSDSEPHCPGLWVRRPVCVNRPFSRYLREIDRLFVGSPGSEIPVSPYSIAETSDGHIFATLHKADDLVHLDSHGKVLGRIGLNEYAGRPFREPGGIATDGRDRLWVANFASHRIDIYDPAKDEIVCIRTPVGNPTPLRFPIGVCRGFGDSMLVADWGNHRIVALEESGALEVICGRFGKGPGELRHPVAIDHSCKEDASASIWVADQLNHRIQKLDAAGNPILEIGGCGLGKNRMILPECVVTLSGSLLAVSHWRFNTEIKLISLKGQELDCMPVDYAPAGMLVHEGLLLVAAWNGNHIHVYECR